MQKTKSRVYLRPLAQHDLDRVLKWHNDADPYSTLRGHFRYVSREAETEWLRRRLEARDEVNVAICLSEPPQHIGNIYFAQHRLGRPKMPNYTHLLQWEHRGKGYGSTAVRLSAKRLSLHRPARATWRAALLYNEGENCIIILVFTKWMR